MIEITQARQFSFEFMTKSSCDERWRMRDEGWDTWMRDERWETRWDEKWEDMGNDWAWEMTGHGRSQEARDTVADEEWEMKGDGRLEKKRDEKRWER